MTNTPHDEDSIGDILATVTKRLDAMIESAPEEPGQTPVRSDSSRISLHDSAGWPRRMILATDTPRGERWLLAYAEARETVKSGGLVLLHGKRGSGKTRMAAELARAGEFPVSYRREPDPMGGTRRVPERRAIYRTAMAIFLEIRATYGKTKTETEKAVIERLTQPGLLVIDELQERGDSPWEDRLITHLLDCRYSAMLPTIIIANLTAAELKAALSPSVIDRFHECGCRIEFDWNSYRRPQP